MAWTPDKAVLLGNLFRERLVVENDPDLVLQWGLTRSWANILNQNVTDASKQLILNELIDDKIIYLNNVSDNASAIITNAGTDIVDLNANKE